MFWSCYLFRGNRAGSQELLGKKPIYLTLTSLPQTVYVQDLIAFSIFFFFARPDSELEFEQHMTPVAPILPVRAEFDLRPKVFPIYA